MAESDSIHLTHILKLLDKAQARAETHKTKAAQAPHDTAHSAKAPPQPQKPISHLPPSGAARTISLLRIFSTPIRRMT